MGSRGLGEGLGLHPLTASGLPGSMAVAEPSPSLASPREGPAFRCRVPCQGCASVFRAYTAGAQVKGGLLVKAQRQPREVQGQPRGVWRQCWEPGAVPSHSVPPPRNFRGFSLTACLALLLGPGVCSCRTFQSLKCLGDRESDWSLPHQ